MIAISDSEYSERISALQARCKAEGLDAVAVWAKGGHSDSAAGVSYLANYYPRFNRSQAALMVPSDRDPILGVDILDLRRDVIRSR